MASETRQKPYDDGMTHRLRNGLHILLTLFGIMGATVAIRSLEQKARRLQEQHAEQWSRLCLPTVTGGGSDKAKRLGWLGAYGLIWLLILFWAVVTTVSVSLKWWPALLSRF